jgi:hypothetical protein
MRLVFFFMVHLQGYLNPHHGNARSVRSAFPTVVPEKFLAEFLGFESLQVHHKKEHQAHSAWCSFLSFASPDLNPAFLRRAQKSLGSSPRTEKDAERGWRTAGSEPLHPLLSRAPPLTRKLPQKLDQNFVFGQDASQIKKRFNPFGLKRFL